MAKIILNDEERLRLSNYHFVYIKFEDLKYKDKLIRINKNSILIFSSINNEKKDKSIKNQSLKNWGDKNVKM